MVIFPYFDLSTFLWGLGKFLLWLPILAIAENPVDPSVPSPEEPTPTDPGTDGGTSGGGGSGDITVTSGSRVLGTVSATSYTGSTPGAQYTMYGSYSGNSGDTIRKRIRVYKDGVQESDKANGNTTASSASWDSNDNSQTDPICDADNNTYSWRARAYNVTQNIEVNGGLLYFKSAAIAATAAAPTTPTVGAGTLEATEAYITTTCYPNTKHSTATLQFQYKRSIDSTWTDFNTSATTGGYSVVTFSRNLTGLTPSTSYDVRLKITRTTVNETTAYSSTTTFTTPANTPTITTVAASSIGQTTANLNSTLSIGNQSSVNVKFVYGTANPPVAGVGGALEVSYASNPATADGSYQKALTGLSAATTYYFFAKVYWNSDSQSSSGSVLSFTTGAVVDELSLAAEEAQMQIFEFNERKYGVAADGSSQSKFYFTVAAPAASNSNYFFNDTSPFTNAGTDGDVRISKDGGAWAKVDALPTRVGTSPVFALGLTATEMQASTIVILITDESGSTTPAFRDALLVIRTKQEIGKLDVDASAITNATAATFTGNGSGHGISAVAGATGKDIDGVLGEMVIRKSTATAGGASTITLDASANTTNDYYNGNLIYIIGGTGAGQSRVITDYVGGATLQATVHKAWSVNPSSDSVFVIIPGPDVWEIPNTAEVSSTPAVTATWRELMAFVWQRFAFKRTQTSSLFTMYDGSNVAKMKATVSDSGGTQTFGKVENV